MPSPYLAPGCPRLVAAQDGKACLGPIKNTKIVLGPSGHILQDLPSCGLLRGVDKTKKKGFAHNMNALHPVLKTMAFESWPILGLQT